MKGGKILGAVVIIGVSLGGAYGIADWRVGDIQDDLDELEETVGIVGDDVEEIRVTEETWDSVLSSIVSEFEEKLVGAEVEGMGMTKEVVDKRRALTRKFNEQTISSNEVTELRLILDEEKAKAKAYNNSLAVLATSVMLGLLPPA
jgi:hypothetical protein